MSLCSLVPGELERKCVRAKQFANSIIEFYLNLWFMLVDSSLVICWRSLFVILGVLSLFSPFTGNSTFDGKSP